MPLVLLLLPLASDQVLGLGERLREGLRLREALRPALGLGTAGLLLNLPNRFTSTFAASPAERGILVATAWRNQGRYERALELAGELEQRFPTDPDVLVLRAELLAGHGRCRDAEPLLKRTLQLAPRTATPRVLLADCYESLGRPDDAARELANTLALHPWHPLALRNATLLFRRERRPKEAKALASRFLQAGYDDPTMRQIAGG